MPDGSLARRYAKAFVEISTKKGIVDPVGNDLVALAEAVASSHDLQIMLRTPAIDEKSRMRVLDAVLLRMEAQPETRLLVEALLKRGRITKLHAVALAYRALADQLAGRVRAEVVSAEKLDQLRVSRIQQALETATGKKVVVVLREDPSLLGGIVTQIGSWVYDGSLKTQLQNLRASLQEH